MFKFDLESLFFDNLDKMLCDAPLSDHIGIAVSGGVDSVALSLLTVKWIEGNFAKFGKKRKVTLFTVNHNLRPESEIETLYVKNLAEERFKCDISILNWYNGDNENNIQARAREGRYNLITTECKIKGINNLLTGHHEDDMVETFYLRQKRKSGTLGLCSSYTYFVNDIRILRPLFNIKKADLINYLLENNTIWYEDQSNQFIKYERNLCRKEIALLSKSEQAKISEKLIQNNQKSIDINNDLISAIAEIVQINNFGIAVIDLKKFFQNNFDIKVRLLNFSLAIVSGKLFPRYRLIENIMCKLDSMQNFICTAHGCVVKKSSNDVLVVYREYNRISNTQIKMIQGAKWDNRFVFNYKNGNSLWNNALIDKISENDWIMIKSDKIFPNTRPLCNYLTNKELIFTLPVLKILEKVVAIPHINYYCNVCCEENLDFDIDIVFQSNLVSRFTHFF